MSNHENTGYGYPLAVNAGQLVLVSEGDLKRSHIRHVLETELNENPMRPDYGIVAPLFSAQSAQTSSTFTSAVLRALEASVSGCSFVVQSNINDAGEMLLDVFWSYQDAVSDELIRLEIT